ncbi:AAA family ATPase [Jiella marina]|uniref:AAA family ATPase n=1 Tax=Jiella sp. LLJ827 TaxID=2917712 RepID=UPI0021016BEE|nr:AAA family ATPase [Jiella sp. LLJ827]MCQ0990536.1 AAA family ATPase [Jiella sp. LLJ827]
MLTHIKKIKNLGVFDNYTKAVELKAFERFNVVYGENGSGKTTFSRLLGCLQSGEHKDYPNLEFNIDTQSGPLVQGQKYVRNVRVFNSDFVEANIGRFDGPLRHILILGEGNKAVAEEIKAEIVTRDDRAKRLQDIANAVTKLEADRGKIFSAIAKTIGEATSGSTLRNYRKPDAERAFGKVGEATALSESDLAAHRATVRQEQMSEVGKLNVPRIVEPGTENTIDPVSAAHALAQRCGALTMRSAQSAVVARLASHPKIATWVEEGVDLHRDHNSETCEFCAQPLPAARLKALADHFSVQDQQLKNEIDHERAWLATVLEALGRFTLPDRLALYSELRSEYDAAVSAFTVELEAVKEWMTAIDGALADKLTRRTETYVAEVDSDAEPLKAALAAIANVMERHDTKTKGFEAEKILARDAIEDHYLLTIKDQVAEIAQKIASYEAEENVLTDGGESLPDKRSLADIRQSILDKQAQISNEHKGGEELTAHLKQFLGRTDLVFENSKEGYVVLRRGKSAKRLSEGEKTAIAFLYFLVQLKDQDFDLAEGIVVIDDPISSLDSGAIYQAFSFLKNETKGAKQLFILTHNHEFLRLVINWFHSFKKQCSYSMVLCSETADGRSARLAPLDHLLIEHATEYHYLFKVLYTFQADGTIMSCYHIPNVARKVLEAFLEFHVPSNKSLYLKLDETNFDPHKKTAIYKFTNDLSHFTGKGFDPALVTETQKNTTYLLEMIKGVAPSHFAGLEALTKA